MAEFQDTELQELDESPVEATIVVPSISRESLQLGISKSPAIRSNVKRVLASATLAKPASTVTPIEPPAAPEIKAAIPPIKEAALIAEETSSAFSIKRSILKLIRAGDDQLTEMKLNIVSSFDAAVAYVSKFADKVRTFCSDSIAALLDTFVWAYTKVTGFFKEALDSSEEVDSEHSETSLRPRIIASNASLFRRLLLPFTGDTPSDSAPENSPVAHTELPDLEAKSLVKLLLESIKKISEELLAKKERDKEEAAEEEQYERLKRCEEEAKERLREAISLRPDLADELALFQQEFILASAFDEIPNVDTLIADAERRKADKLVIN